MPLLLSTIIESIQDKEAAALDFLKHTLKGTPYADHVWLAGGAVRDEIMGKPVKDIDVTVSQPDGGIEFANWLTKKIGAYKEGANPVVFPRFGTAKFNLRGINHNGIDLSGVDIESVMTRGEKYEKGSRKPEVVFADLEDDAFRRDLTVNSLFKNLVTGQILDLTGKGVSDIKNGIVRTPMDPDQTFKDDPLRMLRAIRFAVKYNWKMPLSLVKALKKNASMLQNISHERIQDELNKILMTDNPDKGLRVLSATGLNKYVIPELDVCRGVTQNQYHKDDVFDHILEVVKKTPKDLTARLAALFHDIGKPQTRTDTNGKVQFLGHEDEGAKIAQEVMQRLRYSSDITNSVASIVSAHMRLKSAGPQGDKVSDKALRKFMADLGSDLEPALLMMNADNKSHSDESSMPNQIPKIHERMKELRLATPNAKPKLPINGTDIMQALNLKPGPILKSLLGAVEDAWYEDPTLDAESALHIVKKAYERQQAPNTNNTDVLNQKVRNPETQNDILVKTALKYDKDHPAYKAAVEKLK